MNIKIFKYDPATDAAPRYVEHEVPYKEFMTVLEIITYVHEECEAVSFDYSCHGRQCGRCSVMLDGTPVLACCAVVDDSDHTIEPLAGMPVIRDLVTSRTKFDDRLSGLYTRVRVEPFRPEDVPNTEVSAISETLYNMSNCTRCGACQAACPVYASMPDKYAGPAAMLATAYRFLDPYDQADRTLEAVSMGLYRCIQCGICDQVCPRVEIDHLGAWATLRSSAEARGLVPSYA